MSTGMNHSIRPLTHDEKKAAEAAFRGAPFNPKWSEAARKVYQGISSTLSEKPSKILSELAARTPALSAKSTVVEKKKSGARSKTKIQ